MKKLPDLANEIAAVDQDRARIAETIKSNKEGSGPRGSYFSRTIGLDKGSLAPTGRAVCLHCKKPISKGSVRYHWYYSTVRPNAFLHGYCLRPQALQTNLQDATVKKLIEIVQSAPSGSSSSSQAPDAEFQVAEFSRNILEALCGS